MLLYLHTLGTSVVKREIEYSDCQGLVQDRLLVDYNSSVHIYICIYVYFINVNVKTITLYNLQHNMYYSTYHTLTALTYLLHISPPKAHRPSAVKCIPPDPAKDPSRQYAWSMPSSK